MLVLMRKVIALQSEVCLSDTILNAQLQLLFLIWRLYKRHSMGVSLGLQIVDTDDVVCQDWGAWLIYYKRCVLHIVSYNVWRVCVVGGGLLQ